MQKQWDRLLWAIESSELQEKSMLIGRDWGHTRERGGQKSHASEPSRALLFTSRAAAREWCEIEHALYAGRADCCVNWRFRPVRVRETVRRTR